MKNFNGKSIYTPDGAAGEYATKACNFYVGCSNGCTYCYLKKGVLSKALGGDTPTLKKCFKSEEHALEVFEKELLQNKAELQEHGLFFTFTSDPMLSTTMDMTFKAVNIAVENGISVKVLTKRADWLHEVNMTCNYRDKIAFGFTLTGHDELEPNASTNAERIEAMKKLRKAGFPTFASIEPIIDFPSAYKMVDESLGYCDLYKVGLMSGAKVPDQKELFRFVDSIATLCDMAKCKVYFKESITKHTGELRGCLPAVVRREYNMFKN